MYYERKKSSVTAKNVLSVCLSGQTKQTFFFQRGPVTSTITYFPSIKSGGKLGLGQGGTNEKGEVECVCVSGTFLLVYFCFPISGTAICFDQSGGY